MPAEKKVRKIQKVRVHVDRRGAIYDLHAALQILDSLNGSTTPEVAIAKSFMGNALRKLGNMETEIKQSETEEVSA